MTDNYTAQGRSLLLFLLLSSEIAFKYATGYVEHTQTKLAIRAGRKYILQWTKSGMFKEMGKQIFSKHNCSENNCFVTTDKNYFKNITRFDFIVFNGPDIARYGISRPKIRSPKQVYIFESQESSHNYPICLAKYNNFFNWTWTYKLSSDLLNANFIIRDWQGDVIGPHEAMNWIKIEEMSPISDTIKQKVDKKIRAVAWFVSNCNTSSDREGFVKRLGNSLVRYDLRLDIYGKCGDLRCERDILMPSCWELLERDYYFYFAFENSFSEDYVTEKVVNALLHFSVPVVYGTANYTRFMPDGIYLNAFQLGPTRLAEEMFDIINDKERYYKFFRWHNHYSYHFPNSAPDSDNYCRFCEMAHDKNAPNQTIGDFVDWWNDNPDTCH